MALASMVQALALRVEGLRPWPCDLWLGLGFDGPGLGLEG